MPQILIHYEPARPVEVAVLHAWHPDRGPWHLERPANADGTFDFVLEHDVADVREIKFKYMFPREGDRWEADDYVRRIPTTDIAQLWTFDYTARCLRQPPYTAPPPDEITFLVPTRRFAGGSLFVWSEGSSQHVHESSRDDANSTSTFRVPRQPWNERGFLCKLVTADGQFEPERYNRIWKPVDADRVWVKSGRLDLSAAPLELREAEIELVWPKAFVAPVLEVWDDVDDFRDSLSHVGIEDLDERFWVLRYRVSVYVDAQYWTEVVRPDNQDVVWRRPFRLLEGMDAIRSVAVVGNDRWLAERPARTAHVELVIHPNPRSAFAAELACDVGIGDSIAHERVTAERQPDNTWKTALQVFPEIRHWINLEDTDGRTEHRPDGPFDRRRWFSATVDADSVLHTIDGVAGIAAERVAEFADVSESTRRALMGAVFSPEIASQGVFDAWEMPHGAVRMDDQVWFVLRAPHASCAELILLDEHDAGASPRSVTSIPMRLTDDLRYLWCQVAAAGVPHGTHYRFVLNGNQEVVDPAARWAHDPGRLWCRRGEGKEGPWARFLDPQRLEENFRGSSWRTMGWEALLTYELHARRLTRRNEHVQSDFDQLVRELQPGRYLHGLGVTALELLPVHEFPRDQSWGYNPSLFFSVDSAYGGPLEFARFVRASHDAGRAVLLDVVYNHMNESPLETIALDVYVSGETNWGNMVHYAHPACVEFFRQAFVYIWRAYHLDGFRFDATEAIVNGHKPNGYILRRPGNGRGWEFIGALRDAVRRAADASGEPWPYLVAENDPNNWPLSNSNRQHGGVMDAQWHFDHHYRLNDAARNLHDITSSVREQMDWPHSQLRPFYEATRFAESHDSTSGQEDWKKRIVRREAWGFGRQMAKAIGAAVILAKGVPMLFMGQEAGEDRPFFFGMDDLHDPSRYLRLDEYEMPGEMNRILRWFQHLLGLRNNPRNQLRGDDDQAVFSTPKTLAFTRASGRFFVVVTLGTPDLVQNLGWLGLPAEGSYKEIFNSSWPDYRTGDEPPRYNGGYDAQLNSSQNVNLPTIGAIVLERR